MNILFLINFAGKGGTEKYVYELTKTLDHRDTAFFIFGERGSNKDGDLYSQMSDMGIEPKQVTMSGPFDKKAAKTIGAFCNDNAIDIIHTQFLRENYIALMAKKYRPSLKVIYTSHIILKNNIVWKTTNRFMSKKNDAIIAVCSKARDVLVENNMPPDKIKVIFNGIDYEKCKKNENTIVRDQLDIDKDVFVFTTLTRFSEEKGNMFLLESVNKLKDMPNPPPFKLLIGGDGALLAEAKAYVENNNLSDVVIFLGYRTDSDNVLEAANAYLNSSQNEALSFAILEAMAKGMPIIATDIGGNVDIINDSTNCGLLSPYGDSDHYAKNMYNLMTNENLYNLFSNNAIKAIKEVFTKENSIGKTLEIYKNLKETTHD